MSEKSKVEPAVGQVWRLNHPPSTTWECDSISGPIVYLTGDHGENSTYSYGPRPCPPVREPQPPCAPWPQARYPHLDAREQGPGIARLKPAPAAPDVVYTWEAWALP